MVEIDKLLMLAFVLAISQLGGFEFWFGLKVRSWDKILSGLFFIITSCCLAYFQFIKGV